MNIDHTIFFHLYSLAHQSVFLDWLIIFCTNMFGITMVAILAVQLFLHSGGDFDYRRPFLQLKNKIKETTFVIMTGVVAYGVGEIIKYLVTKPRPFILFDNIKPLILHGGLDSFPSGHATFFSAIAVVLLIKNHRRMGILYIFVTLIVSLTRVIAGIHFPIDILTGWILGTLTAIILNKFILISKENSDFEHLN